MQAGLLLMLLTAGRVPRDVAVDQPDARVICAHCDGDVALFRKQHDVASRGIVEVEEGEAWRGARGVSID